MVLYCPECACFNTRSQGTTRSSAFSQQESSSHDQQNTIPSQTEWSRRSGPTGPHSATGKSLSQSCRVVGRRQSSLEPTPTHPQRHRCADAEQTTQSRLVRETFQSNYRPPYGHLGPAFRNSMTPRLHYPTSPHVQISRLS